MAYCGSHFDPLAFVASYRGEGHDSRYFTTCAKHVLTFGIMGVESSRADLGYHTLGGSCPSASGREKSNTLHKK